MITWWYLLALPLVAGLAGAHTAVDRWLFSLPRPLPPVAELVLTARWTFLAWILVYAFLIDSHRVPYEEPAIWVLGVVGGVLTIGLAALVQWVQQRRTRRGKGRKKGRGK